MRRLYAALAALVVALPAHAAQPSTWSFRQIRIGQAQAAGRNGAGVTVAVIDTWIDWAHPDFGGRVLTGADCVGGTCVPGHVAPDKCEAHATHVAGIVASATYGVAPAAKILPLRVLKWDGKDCTGTSSDLAVAVRYATAHGARVVNISAGAAVPLAGHDTDLDAAVAAAAQAGVVVVFAAGNANLPVADSYGGDALIVAATGPDGHLASYSQYGNGVDLAAPGGDPATDTCTVEECVVSTWSDGTHDQFAALAGTSMAAPHVSGVAALLFAQRTRTRDQVISRLRDTARPLANAGDGLLDASAALGVSASPAPAPRPTPTHVVVRPRTKTTVRTPAPTTPPAVAASAMPRPTTPPPATPAESAVATAPPSTPAAAEPPAAEQRDDRTLPIGVAALLVLVTGTATVRLRSSG